MVLRGIIAFLEKTQNFFIAQRLVWAMIIIVRTPSYLACPQYKAIGIGMFLRLLHTDFLQAIGMSMTSGQSLFGFFGRIAGTAIAMVLSIVIWYIVDEKTPGIIVFLWLVIFCAMYFFLKFPRFLPISLISIVTLVLVTGYELQVRKLGLAACKSAISC